MTQRITTSPVGGPDGANGLVRRLAELGFSIYEARAYLGLLGDDGLTGYALAQRTGLPQPKVYETLRRLVQRGAAVQVDSEPARYAALPPARLLQGLKTTFHEQLAAAQTELERLPGATAEEWQEPLRRSAGWPAVRARADELIAGARRRLYVTGWARHLRELRPALEAADERGVAITLLHFGDLRVSLPHGRAWRHASTEGTIYRSHRARQLGIVADSAQALWALAPDGDDWSAVTSADERIVALLKAYVRHDVYVQRIYDRFGEELHDAFGPALERLIDIAADDHDPIDERDEPPRRASA